jgi:glycosyltransferase involved in cell wall biosynthesis
VTPTDAAVREFKRSHQLPDRFLLFLGNTDPKKNLRNVVLGFLHYLDANPGSVPLVIADLEAPVLERIVPEARTALDRGQVHLTGYIPHRDIPILYAAADVFLYPSLRESFGLPILEAMSAGTPVITSNTASMPEVAGDAGLLVDPTAPEHIGSLIAFVQSNDTLRQTLARRGRDRAMAFSWRNSALKLAEIYDDFEIPSQHIRHRAA